MQRKRRVLLFFSPPSHSMPFEVFFFSRSKSRQRTRTFSPFTTLRLRAFVLISALTGVAVAFVGTIGFVGLVAPHLARMAIGEDQRGFLPASALLGALLLSLASVASKTLSPGAILPIGIVTSLIGVPFFIWMVLRTRRSYW